MERRLYRHHHEPGHDDCLGAGPWLAWSSYRFTGGWLHAKLLFVVIMTGAHVYFGRAVRAFARDERQLTGRQWRMLNEARHSR